MENKQILTIPKLIEEAQLFCIEESKFEHKELFGVTDGKAVGTLIEQKFQKHLNEKYEVAIGNSASGIDLPSDEIQTDIKVTSRKKPQSSCPFDNIEQKIYGLGYNLLVFVYDKKDNQENKTSTLNFVSCSFVSKERTADFSTTRRLREMVNDDADVSDIVGYFHDRNIPGEDIALIKLAERVLDNLPQQGYLTISNAFQWRLDYGRLVKLTADVDGISKIISSNEAK